MGKNVIGHQSTEDLHISYTNYCIQSCPTLAMQTTTKSNRMLKYQCNSSYTRN
jgi:hypothetical protein